jgi:hypothetical protein
MVVITLAVALALQTSVVAVVNAYLIRSLPYPAADRLYQVTWARPGENAPTGLSDLDWASLSDVVVGGLGPRRVHVRRSTPGAPARG